MNAIKERCMSTILQWHYTPHVHPGPLGEVLGAHDAVSGLVGGRRADGEGPGAAAEAAAAAVGEAGRHGGGGGAEAAAHAAAVAVVVVEAVAVAAVVDPVAVPIEVRAVAPVATEGALKKDLIHEREKGSLQTAA